MSTAVKTVWYINDDNSNEECEDVIEQDFLKITVHHPIVSRQRVVQGTLLITPTQFIFEVITKDPLDLLELDQFQVVLPTSVIDNLILTSKPSQEDPSQNIQNLRQDCVQLKVTIKPEKQGPHCQVSSYGSSHLLSQYSFLIKDNISFHLEKFCVDWFNKSLISKIYHHSYDSKILTNHQCLELERYFPPRCITHSWYQGNVMFCTYIPVTAFLELIFFLQFIQLWSMVSLWQISIENVHLEKDLLYL